MRFVPFLLDRIGYDTRVRDLAVVFGTPTPLGPQPQVLSPVSHVPWIFKPAGGVSAAHAAIRTVPNTRVKVTVRFLDEGVAPQVAVAQAHTNGQGVASIRIQVQRIWLGVRYELSAAVEDGTGRTGPVTIVRGIVEIETD